MFNPPYADAHTVARADQTDNKWRNDVLKMCTKMMGWGSASLVWDVYKCRNLSPNLYDLTREIRELARRKDAQSVFAAESCSPLEFEANHIDYTWNWIDWEDRRPLVSAFPTPRINVNINYDPITVRMSFMDNLYLNVMPSRPGDVNGSAMIADYPDLSKALKQCDNLRKQFLPYFIEGTMIGECVLAEQCPGAHITAYVLGKRMLLMALNREEDKSLTIKADLKPWLPSASGGYIVKTYDMDGNGSQSGETSTDWRRATKSLGRGDMLIYEFVTP